MAILLLLLNFSYKYKVTSHTSKQGYIYPQYKNEKDCKKSSTLGSRTWTNMYDDAVGTLSE